MPVWSRTIFPEMANADYAGHPGNQGCAHSMGAGSLTPLCLILGAYQGHEFGGLPTRYSDQLGINDGRGHTDQYIGQTIFQ